jgi:hypothetical protein
MSPGIELALVALLSSCPEIAVHLHISGWNMQSEMHDEAHEDVLCVNSLANILNPHFSIGRTSHQFKDRSQPSRLHVSLGKLGLNRAESLVNPNMANPNRTPQEWQNLGNVCSVLFPASQAPTIPSGRSFAITLDEQWWLPQVSIMTGFFPNQRNLDCIKKITSFPETLEVSAGFSFCNTVFYSASKFVVDINLDDATTFRFEEQRNMSLDINIPRLDQIVVRLQEPDIGLKIDVSFGIVAENDMISVYVSLFVVFLWCLNSSL